MRRKCLITGSRGLLGTHLSQQLKDDELYLIVKNDNTEAFNHLPDNCTIIQADLTEENFCDQLPEKMDAVVHLAQSNHFRMFPEKALDIATVNTFSTLRLLDYAKRAEAQHFIYASSGGVYHAGKGLCVEDEALSIQSNAGMYACSKLAGELFVDAYAKLMTTVVLRFFFIYGPEQNSTMLIPRLVQSVIDGQPIALQGEEGIRINPIYVTDAARAVEAALKLPSSMTVNIAGPEVLSLKSIGNMIGEGVSKKAVFKNDLTQKPLDLIGDIQKMKKLLIEPKVGLEEGVSHLLRAGPFTTSISR